MHKIQTLGRVNDPAELGQKTIGPAPAMPGRCVAEAARLQCSQNALVTGEPTVTDWLGALGSVVGALGTVLTFAVGLVLFAGQMHDRRRIHAALVAVWVAQYDDDTSDRHWNLCILNNGQQPVYNVNIQASHGRVEDVPGRLVGEVRRGQVFSEVKVVNDDVLDVGPLEPNRKEERSLITAKFVDFPDREARARAIDLTSAVLHWTVSFTDTNGRRWVRDERGRLQSE